MDDSTGPVSTDGELERLRKGIREHRDARGDDRCWRDDEMLYALLPEGYTAPARDTAVELARCQQYIACRHNPATTYISPQRRIEELEGTLHKIETLIICQLEVISQILTVKKLT